MKTSTRVCGFHFLALDFVSGVPGSKLKDSAVSSVFPKWPTYLKPEKSTEYRSLVRKVNVCDDGDVELPAPQSSSSSAGVDFDQAREDTVHDHGGYSKPLMEYPVKAYVMELVRERSKPI